MTFSKTVRAGVRLGLILLALPGPGWGAEAKEAPPAIPPAMFTAPAPAVQAYAQKSGIAWEEVGELREGGARMGDTVIALASFFDEGKQRQWLVRLAIDAPNEKEKAEKEDGESVFYTSTGRTFRFGAKRTMLNLETIGPFDTAGAMKGEPKIQRARTSANEAFLALGIHRVSEFFEVVLAFKAKAGKDEHFNYNFGSNPFPAEVTAEGKKMAERIGLTESTERAFGGAVPALLEFFQITRDTPGIRDILLEILEKPSTWAMVRAVATRSININFAFAGEGQGAVDANAWKLRVAAVNAVPMTLELSGKPALALTLYATEPRPPLRASAGIVGLVATSVKNPKRFLVIRVLAIR